MRQRPPKWLSKNVCDGTCPGKSQAQFCQDKFALTEAGCKRKGFYVDIGAGHGRKDSNTYLLDTEYGWRGLCIDPNMRAMEERSCTQYRVVVGPRRIHDVSPR